MKIDRIKLSQEFISQLGNKWFGAEAVLDPGENADEAMEKLAKKINQWGNPSVNMDTVSPAQGAPSTHTPVINRAHERLLILIENATTTGDLKTLRDDVDKFNVPAINDAYYIKYGKLSQ